MAFYLQSLGIVNALGNDCESVLRNMLAGQVPLQQCDWVANKVTFIAPVSAPLLPVPPPLYPWRSRNLQLALTAIEQIRPAIQAACDAYGADRIAVVTGTSTSGIGEGEAAIAAAEEHGQRPADYHYRQQEIGNLGPLIARHLQLNGPAYTLSTACSSSAHALGSARRLLMSGLADAVVVGGADSLCRLTVNGFAALESTSTTPAAPFSRNRNGISIGEGAAFFLLTRELLGDQPEAIELLAVGASSDAHHISAPDPQGLGAQAAIAMALKDAGVAAKDVGYINLHGTGTPLNDAMEADVVSRCFPHQPWCSSSKGQIGHTLGAAGASEAALSWLVLSNLNSAGHLPPHSWDGVWDERLPRLKLVEAPARLPENARKIILSNSFAFGGNNAVVILAGAQ
jgi:3-oxoacyl-[acyl-carrier-protein] synthase-1